MRPRAPKLLGFSRSGPDPLPREPGRCNLLYIQNLRIGTENEGMTVEGENLQRT